MRSTGPRACRIGRSLAGLRAFEYVPGFAMPVLAPVLQSLTIGNGSRGGDWREVANGVHCWLPGLRQAQTRHCFGHSYGTTRMKSTLSSDFGSPTRWKGEVRACVQIAVGVGVFSRNTTLILSEPCVMLWIWVE